jgi:hypothetical protein
MEGAFLGRPWVAINQIKAIAIERMILDYGASLFMVFLF